MADDGRPSGAQIRRQVLGDAYVDRIGQIEDPNLAAFFQTGIEHVWGGVWNRPGLDLKYRSLVTVTALATLGRLHELRTHIRGALNVGWTPEEMREALLQIAGYAGFPASVDALRALSDVLNEQS